MEGLNFNIFNVIILLGITHGLIFSAVLFLSKKLRNRTNNYLALTILSLSLSNLQYLLIDIELYPKDFYLIFIPFEFLMLPFFYLFVNSYIDNKISLHKFIYLFSLFVLTILFQIILANFEISINYTTFFYNILEYLSLIYSVLLILHIFYVIHIYEKNNDSYNANQLSVKIKWLKNTLIFGLLLCSLWILTLLFFNNFLKSGYYRFYPLWIGISILIYWLAYTSLFQMNILNQRKSIRSKSKAYSNENHSNKNSEDTAFNRIKNTIINEKLYLNPKLGLQQLSEILDLSESYISRIFNSNSDINFNDFINQLRIEESEQMLASVDFKNYTVEAIGLECGFNSKSSFYAAFKKFTGKTPVQYKKDVLNI